MANAVSASGPAPSVAMNVSQASSKEAAGKDPVNTASAAVYKDSEVQPLTKEEQSLFENTFFYLINTHKSRIEELGQKELSSDEQTKFKRILRVAFPFFKEPDAHLQGTLIFLDGKEYIVQPYKNSEELKEDANAKKHYLWGIYKYEQVIGNPSTRKTVWKIMNLMNRWSCVLEKYHSPEDMEKELKMRQTVDLKDLYFEPYELRIIKSDTVQRSLHGLIFGYYSNLDQFLQPFSESIYTDICKNLMNKLKILWDNSFVHNNLKPSNIFLHAYCNRVAFGDWNMAMALSPETYENATVKGSPLFTSVLDLQNIQEAQEHYRKAKSAPKNTAQYLSALKKAEDKCREAFIQKDLFAAAVTMYKVVVGRLPYQKVEGGCIKPTSTDGETIRANMNGKNKEPLREFIIELLSLNPSHRPSSEEFLKRWHEAFNSSSCVIS